MSHEDLPMCPPIPLPRDLNSLRRPVLITKDYYDKLPEREKRHYERMADITGGEGFGEKEAKEVSIRNTNT